MCPPITVPTTPDAAPSAVDKVSLLPLFGWMVGVTREWIDGLSSNITYAENSLDNAAQLSRKAPRSMVRVATAMLSGFRSPTRSSVVYRDPTR